MDFKNILYHKENQIVTLTLNRPPANAINLDTLLEIESALNQAEEDKDVRVLIISGAGDKGFSAGFDVTDIAKGNIAGPKGQELWTRIDRFSKPVIAAINGYAFGGGCELSMACTFRVMVESGKIGLPELNLAIIPGWGGTQRMPRLLGKTKALEMILFSKRISAREALEIGLVDKVAQDGELMKDVLEMARLLAERPPLAVHAVLKAVNTGIEKGFEEGNKAETEGNALVGKSKDAMEGFSAFLEKRKPNFTGE
jgi:enoyl-CoA hydratase/carnithine racemase